MVVVEEEEEFEMFEVLVVEKEEEFIEFEEGDVELCT